MDCTAPRHLDRHFLQEGELSAVDRVAVYVVRRRELRRFKGTVFEKERRWFARRQVRERRADYGQPLPSRPRNAPANTTRTPTLGPLKKADDAFRICNVLPSNPRPRRPFATTCSAIKSTLPSI